MSEDHDELQLGGKALNGTYHLLSRLGSGGFGSVYLARGTQGLVALKVVETRAWSEREYQVFNSLLVREASFLRTLDHPGLPKLVDFQAEGTRYYLAMDWVSGKTLHDRVSSPTGPLDLLAAADLLEGLLRILEYLHHHCKPSIVFGDLKPSNVVLTYQGGYRLVDLGLASRERTPVTGTLTAVSPGYSAPELSQGRASARSQDVFSLAATVYFALTGFPPRDAGEPDHRRAHLREHLLASVSRGAKTLPREVHNFLGLVLLGLEFDPGERPSSLEPFGRVLAPLRSAVRVPDRVAATEPQPRMILDALYGKAEGRKQDSSS